MGSLSNLYISQSYTSLIHLGSDTTITTASVELQDGLGNGIGVFVNSLGDLNINGDFQADLTKGYVWVGDGSNRTSLVPTSSLVTNVNTSSLVTTASFNSYTQSTNVRLNNLESTSASVNTSINNLNSTTSSFATSITNLNSNSASVNTSVTNLNSATSSLFASASLGLTTASFAAGTLTFTKGNGTTFGVTIPDVSGSTINTGSFVTTSSFNAYTQSTDSSISQLNASTASQQVSINALNVYTASQSTASIVTSITNLNTFTSSANSRLNNLETTSASLLVETQNLELFSASTLTRLTNIESTTASLNTSVSNLNSATSSLFGSASLGLVTASVNVNVLTFTKGDGSTFNLSVEASGSVTPGTISGSAQITALGFVSSSVTASSLVTASFDNGTRNLTFTKGDASTFAVNIPDVSGSTFNTGSLVTTSSFNAYTQSNDQRVSSLESNSASVNTSITNINYATASLFTSASLAIVTASVNNDDITFTKGDGSQFTIQVATGSFAISASFAETASFALNGGVTQILAGPNIIVSPLSGQGQVTISSTGTGSGNFNTSTGSYGSFYDTTTQTNPVANTARSMSFNETAITNGVSISGSTNPFNTYIKTENAGVYNLQFSAQLDKTDSGTDSVDIWIRKNGIDLLDTATTLTLPTNNSKVVAAWNWFVQSAANDYYQIIWESADTSMRLLAEPSSSAHPGIPSVIATINRVDQFLSNTGSFSGSFTGTFNGYNLTEFTTTSSFNSYTSSTNSRLTNIESTTASLLIETQNLESFSASALVSISNLNSTTASLQGQLTTIGTQSGSWITESETGSFARLDANQIFTGNNTITGNTVVSQSATFGTASFNGPVVINKGINSNVQITGSLTATGEIRTNGATPYFTAAGNTANSGAQFPVFDAIITNANNEYGGFSIYKEGLYPNSTFVGLVANAYSPQYGGTTTPMIIANGNNPGGNDTAIAWTSNGQADHWKQSNFKYGLNVTGSTNIAELTASLQQGYVWVGNASGKTTTVATSSFGGGGGAAFPFTGSAQITGSLGVTGSVSGLVNNLSISSQTASLDFNTGNFFTLQLVSGSTTHLTATNIRPGQAINLLVKTDSGSAAGSGSLTFSPTFKFAGGFDYTPTQITASQDLVSFVTFDTTQIFAGQIKNLS